MRRWLRAGAAATASRTRQGGGSERSGWAVVALLMAATGHAQTRASAPLTTFRSGVSASSFALDTSPTVTRLSISNASATNGSRAATLTLAYTGAL